MTWFDKPLNTVSTHTTSNCPQLLETMLSDNGNHDGCWWWVMIGGQHLWRALLQHLFVAWLLIYCSLLDWTTAALFKNREATTVVICGHHRRKYRWCGHCWYGHRMVTFTSFLRILSSSWMTMVGIIMMRSLAFMDDHGENPRRVLCHDGMHGALLVGGGAHYAAL